MKKRKLTPYERRKIVRHWLESDLSQEEVAAIYKVHHGSISRWYRAMRQESEDRGVSAA